MQSKNYPPNAAQTRWHNALRELGCCITGMPYPELHHVVGAAGKENRVWIGQWFVLMLNSHLHRLGPENVSDWPHRFTDMYGTQRQLFRKQCRRYEDYYGEPVPVPPEVLEAIQMTRK